MSDGNEDNIDFTQFKRLVKPNYIHPSEQKVDEEIKENKK